MKRLNRRTFLRGTGGVAIALPFLDAMRPSRAQAQDSSPRRILFEFKPNGDEVDRRFDALGETDFALGEFLAPLEPYRHDLLFLHRLNKNFHRLDYEERPDNHQQGGSSLAPWPFGDGDFPVGGANRTIGYVLGPSCDYALGDRILSETPGVPYRHLVQRVGDRQNNIWNLHSHAGPEGQKNPVIPETDPFSAYVRLFGFLGLDASDSELQHRLAMRGSVLDLVDGQLTRLRGQLGYEDRQRIDLHAEAIRDLERTLSFGISSPECQALELPEAFDPYAGAYHVEAARLFFKISALAFACDLTRVVNFNWSGNTSQRVYTNLGLTEGHHDISHQSDAAAFANIRAIHRHLWENTTHLYEELLATPDGDGSLWDSTLIVHWNELGQGDWHSTNDDLVVLAGGARNFFHKGRLLDFERGGAFSDLLVACFHYLGFTDVTVFGDPRMSNGGPLPGIMA